MTLADAADQLGVHYMTAYRYVRTGALAAQQRGGRWYVDEGALQAFRDRRALGPRPGRPPRAAAEPQAPVRIARRHADALADRLVEGDQRGAWRLVEDALAAGAGPREVNAALLTPALRRIGDQWEAGDLSVAAEHRATVVAMRLIETAGSRFTRRGRKRGTVVVSGAPGDRHALPTALLADVLRAEGLNVVDLGADTPAEEIARTAAAQDRLLGVGVCATRTLDRSAERRIRDAVRLVHEAVGCPVLVGGSAVTTQAQADRLGADHWSTQADDAVAWFMQLTGPRRRPSEEATP